MADHLSLIEGPFKNFTVRRIRSQDENKVVQHIKDYFLHDEPISKLCGYTEEYGEEFCFLVKHFLPHNMSFWMEDNETGEVAAVRCTFINRKEDEDIIKSFPLKSRALRTLARAGAVVQKDVNIYEKFDITEYAHFLLASCHPKYRNQGLSKELYKRSLILIEANGLTLAKSVFSSQYTRAAVKGLGFVEIARVYFKDLKDNEGNFMFDEKERSQMHEEHFTALMIKQF